jgi:hypothetical protein
MEAASRATSSRRQSVMSIMDAAALGEGGGSAGMGVSSSSMEAALRRGEREKQMELLVRTRFPSNRYVRGVPDCAV